MKSHLRVTRRIRWWCLTLSLRLGLVGAWGTIGHEIVANLAWRSLSSEVQRWLVHDILGPYPNATQEALAGSPLAAVADWADAVRHYLPWSAGLHYIDIRDDLVTGGCHAADPHKGCSFDYARDCPGHYCAAGAILNYTQRLIHSHALLETQSNTHSFIDSNLRQDMMFLVHFVGDIHQPLHCSRISDKGGNDFHVHFALPSNAQAFHEDPKDNLAVAMKARGLRRKEARRVDPQFDRRPEASKHHKSWSLHSVWDTGLIEVALERDYHGSRVLLEEDLWNRTFQTAADGLLGISLEDCPDPLFGGEASGTEGRDCPVVGWGQESWETALAYAYTLPDNQTDVANGSNLTEAYYETRWPLAQDRLLVGGIRLAAVLKAIYDAIRS